MFTLTVAVLGFLALSHAYPTGAPDSACATLNPDSHGPSTATGPPPYNLTISSATYEPNQVIRVSLAGLSSAQFKGFLIVGRKADGSSTDPQGTFVDAPAGSKLACTTSASGNGITHVLNDVKTSIEFTWKAPASNIGNIVFKYTVVRGGAPNTKIDAPDYFMNLSSATLTPANSRPHVLKFQNIMEELQVMHLDGKTEYTEEDIEEILRLKEILRGRDA